MSLVLRRWQRIAVVLLAMAAVPATPAQRVLGERISGERILGDISRIPTPGVTDNAILPVTIEIVRSCVVSASDLDFGAYASNSKAAVLGQTVIQLRCGVGTTAEILLDAGASPGRKRRMSQESGTDRMDYDLYQDSGRTIPWGDRSGRDTLEVVTTGAPQTVPIYGAIPAGQRLRDGTYSDTITLTVQY